MKRHIIPEDIRQFVLASVPSVPFLEALLLMRRNAGMDWGAAELASALYMNEIPAAALLAQLQQAGLVQAAPPDGARFTYAPAPARADLIGRLADVYASNLIGISMLIHAD